VVIDAATPPPPYRAVFVVGLCATGGTVSAWVPQSRRSTGFSRKSTRAFRPAKPFFLWKKGAWERG
jgi:hypothetical protein